MIDSRFVATPWDTVVFGLPTWEIPVPDEDALAAAAATPGHYTVRVDPLADKGLLHRHGFYYCDTLIVPEADALRFRAQNDPRAGIDRAVPLAELEALCQHVFDFGRFHRDFNLSCAQADQRYANWLRQLAGEGEVFALTYDGALAGFFACSGPRILLHAIAPACRGKGLGRALWTRGCQALFAAGHDRLESSVSAANLAIVNLYASLGFRFRSPVDIYHRLTR